MNSSLTTAIVLTIFAGFVLAGMDSLGKILARDFPVMQVTWARFFFHALIVSIVFYIQGYRDFVRTRAPGIQFLRGLFMVGITSSLYLAVQSISLAEATAIMYISPIIVTLLAGVFLGEKVLLRHIAAVTIGFIGALLIIRPGFQQTEPAMFLAISAALCLALYLLLTRKVAAIDHQRTSLFYASIIGATGLSLFLPWWWVSPEPVQWLWFGLMGVLGASGHFLLIRAYTLVSAATLSPWLNAQVVAATLFSVLLFKDVLGWSFFAGTGLIIAAGLMLWMVRREKS